MDFAPAPTIAVVLYLVGKKVNHSRFAWRVIDPCGSPAQLRQGYHTLLIRQHTPALLFSSISALPDIDSSGAVETRIVAPCGI